jgi:hypothetical protein
MNRERKYVRDSLIDGERPICPVSPKSDELVYRLDVAKPVDIDSSSEGGYSFDISTKDEDKDVESEKSNDFVATPEFE